MKKPEVWMRGPVSDVPALLQPVAHALLQAGEELTEALSNFDDATLWIKPAGIASVGFHLRHVTGVLDRLFTYARGESLSAIQLTYLEGEGLPNGDSAVQLLERLHGQIGTALMQLRETPEAGLLEPRGIGRKQIPTNVIGLLFHAAEHTQRHVGQSLVTIMWVKSIAQTH